MLYLCLILFWGETGQKFQEPTSGLQLTFPIGWQLVTDLPQGTALFRATQDEKRWLATFASNQGSQLTVSYLKYIVQRMALNAKKVEVLEAEVHKSDQFQAAWVTFQLTMLPRHVIKYRIYALESGSHAFQLIFAARPKNFSEMLPQIEQVMGSIQFEQVGSALAKAMMKPLDLTPLQIMLNPKSQASTKRLFELLQADAVALNDLKQLVGNAADINGLAHAGTPLAVAVRKDHRQAVLWLLDQGADLHHPGNDETLLFVQAKLPIRLLLESRYQVLSESHTGKSPPGNHGKKLLKPPPSLVSTDWQPNPNQTLVNAITSGNVQLVEKAIANGADINEKIPKYGSSALEFTRQLIEQLEPLRMDTLRWRTIASLLTEADKQSGQ